MEGEKHLATVKLAEGQTAVAEFLLDGPDSYLRIYSQTSLNNWQPPPVILAVLTDGTHITFHDCISLGEQSSFIVGQSNAPIAPMRYLTKLFPHGVVVGGLCLTEEVRFHSAHILVDDASAIFYDPNAFGYDLSPELHIDSILEQIKEKYGKAITSGERPVVGFFRGREKIFEVDSDLGRISVKHLVSRSGGEATGVHLASKIRIDLQLPVADGLVSILNNIRILLRFLEVMAGRPQNILAIGAQLSNDMGTAGRVDIYWLNKPRRQAKGDAPHPADIPINGGVDGEYFGSVMSKWLGRDATRLEARVRFSCAFSGQNFYDVDRIVGAANMFDILPPDALPQDQIQLSEGLTNAQEIARQEFKKLDQTPERDSILSALGRLGKLTLKRKVQHRASFIIAVAAEKFPELNFVLDEAVNCRNRFVHGSSARVDYGRAGMECMPFLTDTLEFVFGASELIEAGWDILEWMNRGRMMTHPWGTYCAHYKRNLNEFKELFS
jgi:hypothetical protein